MVIGISFQPLGDIKPLFCDIKTRNFWKKRPKMAKTSPVLAKQLRTHNSLVVGSNPTGPTTFFLILSEVTINWKNHIPQ